jgi:hypothetical protein
MWWWFILIAGFALGAGGLGAVLIVGFLVLLWFAFTWFMSATKTMFKD